MALLLPIFLLSLQSSFAAVIDAEQQASGASVTHHGGMYVKHGRVHRHKHSRLVRKQEKHEEEDFQHLEQDAAQVPAEPEGFDWTPRLPAFIEAYPNFYGFAFVMAGFSFMAFVCAYVHYEDSKEEERRAIMAEIQREAAMSGGPKPSFAALQAAAEAAEASLARAPPLVIPAKVEERVAPAAPNARAAYKPYQPPRLSAFTVALNSVTSLLVGEKRKGPSTWSHETTSASGASSPRSLNSSQVSSMGARGTKSKGSGIRNGTMLVARVPEVVFASTTSWEEIGVLQIGQQVQAAGPPETEDDYTMVPIKPRGAVDLKTLEVLQDY